MRGESGRYRDLNRAPLSGQVDRGGSTPFIQELTGWKTSILQPIVYFPAL